MSPRDANAIRILLLVSFALGFAAGHLEAVAP